MKLPKTAALLPAENAKNLRVRVIAKKAAESMKDRPSTTEVETITSAAVATGTTRKRGTRGHPKGIVIGRAGMSPERGEIQRTRMKELKRFAIESDRIANASDFCMQRQRYEGSTKAQNQRDQTPEEGEI